MFRHHNFNPYHPYPSPKHNHIHYPYQPHYHQRPNSLPAVNTEQITASAIAFQQLMKVSQKIINRFASSKSFAYAVMDAAQKSDHKKVETLIKEVGISHKIDIHFNPDNIRLTLYANVESIHCCKLEMALHW